MPTKSAYQRQADKRTKNALKLRARFDTKARKAATLLVVALAGADQAKARIDRLNALYNVDISTRTLLVNDLKTAGIDASLAAMMAGSTPGEEMQLFAANVDGNGGAGLALEVVFGELPATTGGGGGVIPPVTTPGFNVLLTGPDDDSDGVTLASAAGTRFEFDALATGGAAPASMDLSVGGAQVASVVYLDRYAGRPFAFTDPLGVTRRGVFGPAATF